MKKPKRYEIGYYGRPITDLTRDELLEAFTELCIILEQCRADNDACRKMLSREKSVAI